MATSPGAVWVFAGLDLPPAGAPHGPVTAPAVAGSPVAGSSVAGPVEAGALAQLRHAVSCLRACFHAGARPAAVVGHSFGEIAALVAAGALTFEDAQRVAGARARAMAAAPAGETGMLAVVGLTPHAVARERLALRDHGHDVQVAAWNGPSQTVVAGGSIDLKAAAERLLAAGASRVRRVPVPVAAHTRWALPMQQAVADALTSVQVSAPTLPVYSAHTADSTVDPVALQQRLVRSITAPVNWTGAVSRLLRDGFRDFHEIGVRDRPVLLGPARELAVQAATRLRSTRYVSSPDEAPDGLVFASRRRVAAG